MTPILLSLNWLPIKFCINYKVLLMNYKAQNGLAPLYLTDLVSPYNTCANSCKDFRLDTQYL